METTFYGVRGSIPAPGPTTVRYGGNTSCVAVKLDNDELIVIDCGTGVRNLGHALQTGDFGQGRGRASFLLSHAHWDHIQGLPFFGPFYTKGNRFTIYGVANASVPLEQILEAQMAAQYFPVQSIRNMNATIEIRSVPADESWNVGSARVLAYANPHGAATALAFRIEHAGKTVVYASDAGYGPAGPTAEALAFYANADLLIHDSTFATADEATRASRGLSSLDQAIAAAMHARVKRLALFHYHPDYSDHDVDRLVARGQRTLAAQGATLALFGAAEGLTVTL